MNLTGIISLSLLFLSSASLAQQISPSTTIPSAVQCTENESPVRLVLKESFRFYPAQTSGVHQFFLLSGCGSNTGHLEMVQVKGEVYTGKEADANYRAQTPKPLEGSVNALTFEGKVVDVKLLTHGSANEVMSDNGQIIVSGNFYSNRDITFSVDGTVVPASLIQ